MSSFEYNDMLLRCQKSGIYHVFTFDIVDSRKMDIDRWKIVQSKFRELVILNYKMIEYIEKKRGILILARPNGENKNYEIGFTHVDKEPVIIGDLSYFTIYRDTLTNREVYDIFECCMHILDIDFKFHYADGYYETNDWVMGDKEYFRGYCIDVLSNLHKSRNKDLRKKLEKAKQ